MSGLLMALQDVIGPSSPGDEADDLPADNTYSEELHAFDPTLDPDTLQTQATHPKNNRNISPYSDDSGNASEDSIIFGSEEGADEDDQPTVKLGTPSGTALLSPIAPLLANICTSENTFVREDSIDSGYADSWSGPSPMSLSPPPSRARVSFNYRHSQSEISMSPRPYYTHAFPVEAEMETVFMSPPVVPPVDACEIALPPSPYIEEEELGEEIEEEIEEQEESFGGDSSFDDPSFYNFPLPPTHAPIPPRTDTTRVIDPHAIQFPPSPLAVEEDEVDEPSFEDSSFVNFPLPPQGSSTLTRTSAIQPDPCNMSLPPSPVSPMVFNDVFASDSATSFFVTDLSPHEIQLPLSPPHLSPKPSPPLSRTAGHKTQSSLSNALKSLRSFVTEDDYLASLPPLPPSLVCTPQSNPQALEEDVDVLKSTKKKWTAVVGELSMLSLDMQPLVRDNYATPSATTKLMAVSPEAPAPADVTLDSEYSQFSEDDEEEGRNADETQIVEERHPSPSLTSSFSSPQHEVLSPPASAPALTSTFSPVTFTFASRTSSPSFRSPTPALSPSPTGERVFTPPPNRGRTDTAETIRPSDGTRSASTGALLGSSFRDESPRRRDKGKAPDRGRGRVSESSWDEVMDAGSVSTKAPFGFRYPYSLVCLISVFLFFSISISDNCKCQ